jgi:streptomycin 6-kinase
MAVSHRDFSVPGNLLAAAREEGREEWLASLPATVARFAEEWALTVGAPFEPGGQTAWVAPAVTARGEERVLKIAWRHAEADHEGDGLRIWAGRGAVVLFEVVELDETIILLLERCRPGSPLSNAPEPAQDEVIAGLLRRLWVEPPVGHRFRPLQEMCSRWADQFDAERAAGHVGLDPTLAAHGIDLFRSLAATADRTVLLCTDLHAGNVLAADREPWLLIDPKPYVGDPTYDVVQHLLNCPARLHANPDRLIGRIADLLDLDRNRLRLWMFARCVQESLGWPELADVARRLRPDEASV